MNYTCPYCGHHSTVVGRDTQNSWNYIYMNTTEKGEIGFGLLTVRCVNMECNKLFLKARLTNSFAIRGNQTEGPLI